MDAQGIDVRTPIIDVHRHCVSNPFPGKLGAVIRGVMRVAAGLRERRGPSSITVKGITSILYPELTDIDPQIRQQDEAGISKSLLSFSMLLETLCQVLRLPSAFVARRLNDATAELVARFPNQLDFLVMVNPFDTASTDECERCFKNYGAKGVSIGTSWKGTFLDSGRAMSFFDYAQAADVAVFLHPPLVPIGYESMNCYKLEETVGRPFDTAMTAARMILSGLFDRYPRLKIVLPHMGGGLPCVVGRLDFAHRLGYAGLPAGQAARCERPPSAYLRSNFYVDTMGFAPAGILQSIALFGSDRILFGTDYAAVPISPREHVDIIKALGLSPEDESRIFWRNAAALFKLSLIQGSARWLLGRNGLPHRDVHQKGGGDRAMAERSSLVALGAPDRFNSLFDRLDAEGDRDVA